jgi:outer membrane protein assembly factor BamA
LGHPSMDDSAATVAYDIKVTEGDVFHMSELLIDGIEASAASKLAAQWQMKKGDVYDASYLGRFFNNMYHEVGLTGSYSVVPKENINRQDKTVSVALHFVPKR